MNEQFNFFLINLLSRILIQSDGTRVPGPSIQTKITPDYRIQRSPPAGLKTRLGMNFLRHSFVLINQLVLLDTSSYLFIVKCVFIAINVMCSSGLKLHFRRTHLPTLSTTSTTSNVECIRHDHFPRLID